MKVQQLRNRAVITGSDDDLARFAAVVEQARDLPFYGGSIDVEQIRQSGLTFANSGLAYPVPDDVTREWIEAGGVRACWFRRGPVDAAGTVLYLHGGGYVGGGVEASRGIAVKLLDSLRVSVLPFGGVKRSGYGRELGDLGAQEFVNKKLIRVQDATSEAL